MSATTSPDTRMERLGYRAPLDVEPDQLVLEEYVSNGRVAIITLNRPHADNAITTALAAQLIEILETVAARPSVRVAVITSAGDRAFSVGGDLYERKQMTKEEWLRQRQVFDRVLYTLRQLRRPIIAAVHGMAYGGGCEIADAQGEAHRGPTCPRRDREPEGSAEAAGALLDLDDGRHLRRLGHRPVGRHMRAVLEGE